MEESYDMIGIMWIGLNKNKQETNSKPPEENNASIQNIHIGI